MRHNLSHRFCEHPHTPAARAACRKARAAMTNPGQLIKADGGYVTADHAFAVFKLDAETAKTEGHRYEVISGIRVVATANTMDEVREAVAGLYVPEEADA